MCLLRLFHKKNAARPAGIRIGETGFAERTAGQPLSGRASALFSLFEKDPAKLSGEERALRAETEEAFLKAGARIGKCPVDIGASFVLPIALAKFLVIRGFTVRSVRAAAFLPEERRRRRRLKVWRRRWRRLPEGCILLYKRACKKAAPERVRLS